MRTTWTHKLPNQYFVGPDGKTATCPSADQPLLRSPLVRQLLGLRPTITVAGDRGVRAFPSVTAFSRRLERHAA